MQKHHGTSTLISTDGSLLLEPLLLFSSGTSGHMGKQLISYFMYTPNLTKSSSSHSYIEVQIPDELEYYLAEAAEYLEITPDELVRQAASSYCREQQWRAS